MPKGARHKREKSSRGIKIVSWLLVIAVMAAAVIFFVTNFYEDTMENMDRANYPQDYANLVEKAAEEYELDPALIFAVIRTESGFAPDAQSGAGACGIMQMMPESFDWLQQIRECEGTYTAEDLYDPEICIDYGCYLLKYFYDYYGTERSAIAAYNAGFRVGEWLEDKKCSNDGVNLIVDKIPYPETKNYVIKVEKAKEMYIKLYYS